MQRYFEVSAQFMKSAGFGDQAAVFPVKLVETNTVGGRGFDAFIELDTGDGWHGEHYVGKTWCVAAARGRFVDAPAPVAVEEAPAQAEQAAPAMGELFETFLGSGKFDAKGREIGWTVGLRDNGVDFHAWVQSARRVKGGEFHDFGVAQRSKKFSNQDAARSWAYATAKARVANLRAA